MSAACNPLLVAYLADTLVVEPVWPLKPQLMSSVQSGPHLQQASSAWVPAR